jgi:predicted CXXCH cytochrome family protein
VGVAHPTAAAERIAAIAVTAAAAIIAVAACSPETRHRVLVFLYDGVPPLGGNVVDLDGNAPEGSLDPATAPTPTSAKLGTRFYTHPLYWENRCGSCHDANGRLLKTVRQGLCQSCHFEKPEDKKKYIHGPVAVNGCLACHRYHKSEHPKVLLEDAQTLCFHCHQTEELTTDKHHATMETERCVDCHDPHGGDDRFYLLPGVVAADSS